MDSIWSEIQVLTPVEAVKELNERLHRDSDFVTLLSFSVPKSLVAIGCLFGIYLALFDLAAWITWDLSQNRKAVNAAEVTWTLLLPTASGLLAVVATLFVLPVVSSCFGMAVFYKTTLSASAVIASFMVSGISGLAMICVTAMSKVRGDEPLVRKCLGLSVLVIFLLLQCQPSVYSAMYVVSTVNREIPSGWGATFLAGALPVLPLATAAQFSLLAMCLLGSGVRLADDTPFVPLDRLGDVVKRKGVLISAGVAIVLLYILPYVMENLPDHWVSPWVSRVAALVESAAVVFAISQGFVATAVSILLCVFIWKRYVQKLV